MTTTTLIIIALALLAAIATAAALSARLDKQKSEDYFRKDRDKQIAAERERVAAERGRIRELEAKYGPVDEAKAEADRRLEKANEEAENLLKEARKSADLTIERRDKAAKERDDLLAELGALHSAADFDAVGLHDPLFAFDDAEEYREEITKIRNEQKEMLKLDTAVVRKRALLRDGNATKGQRLLNDASKLALRAFNYESDAAIAAANGANRDALLKRIEKAETQINKMNSHLAIELAEDYVTLKKDELVLQTSHKAKQKQEKEELAELLREQREEKQLAAEAKKAAEDESKFKEMLAEAQQRAAAAAEEQKAEMQAKVDELQAKLDEATKEKERKKSLAQQTKAGFVYVISNLGSFGERVVKIGMTRRANPQDRVDELGDASVPFQFDVHAFIYSDVARDMEKTLHHRFASRRYNLLNNRKEFFKITLDEAKEAVRDVAPKAMFLDRQEAREFRESEDLRRKADADQDERLAA